MRLFPVLIVAGLAAGIPACSRPEADPRSVTVPVERLRSASARERGRALFLLHCALCHGEHADGRGVRQNLSSRPADLTDRSWRRRTSPKAAFQAVRDGVTGTAMPAWRALDEDEIWDLVAYVLSVADSPPGAANAPAAD